MLYPLRFKPLYMQKPWGGRRLGTVMGRDLPPGQRIGESWEISDHPHGKSLVADGAASGSTLGEIIQRDPEALLGRRAAERWDGFFPLLVKYIDADDKLSVQVHPDDAYAAEHAGEIGKTEAWYVLRAEAGARLIVGLRQGVTREQFARALAHGDPAELLHHMPVKTGDCVFIPAGRIHAILPGLLILEIQQNSDTTYRLYDWGRIGPDGKPRPLQVEEALEVVNWTDYAPRPQAVHPRRVDGNSVARLAACEHFVMEKHDLTAEHALVGSGDSFRILNCVAGSGEMAWEGGVEPLVFGDSLLVPACLTHCVIRPHRAISLVVSFLP